MIKEGTVVKVSGKEGIVCFLTTYNEKEYANVCFGDGDEAEYKIYEVKNYDGNYSFKLEKDPDILSELTYRFVMTA